MRVKTWASVAALAGALIGGGSTYLAQTGTPSVLDVEGGYVNDTNDAGGATNHGVTERVARQHGYAGAMRDLPREFAIQVYEHDYIYGPHFDLILAVSPALGHKVIDAGINVGPATAARWFQQAVNILSRGGRDYSTVSVDGIVGPSTMRAYASLERVRGRVKACQLTMTALDAYQASHYLALGQGQKNSSFVVGWLDHRVGNVSKDRCDEMVAAR